MINKNKNIRSLPVKICFLKDDSKKSSPPRPQEKLSLTFLSSYIQQDRQQQKYFDRDTAYLYSQGINPTNQYNNGDKILPADLNLTQPDITTPNRQNGYFHRQELGSATENVNPRITSTYQKWVEVKKTKKKSMTDEKRFLNNLVGQNWAVAGKNSLPKWMQENKKKTFKKRFDTYQEQQRKEGNQEMLKTHFQCFLENLRVKPETAEVLQQPRMVVTKVDQRLSEKKLCFQEQMTLFERSSRNRSGNFSLMNAAKPITTNPNSRKSHHNQFDSIASRVGFTEIPNFQWFRVNKNAKFKLRKV